MGLSLLDRGLSLLEDLYGTAQTFLDDVALKFGTGGTDSIIYETADADANALIFVSPEGGAVDVPAFIFGDASILNSDLGWFNGLTEPSIVVVNDAKDAYIRIDAGDDGVAGSKGIYFKAAADEIVEIINLSVTGTPRFYWDESGDRFASSHTIAASGLVSEGYVVVTSGGNIRSNNVDAGYVFLQGRDTGVGLIEIGRLVGAADPYISIGRDDTGVATNAITDGLVLQMGAGTNNEAAGQGFGISVKLGNAVSQVEERVSVDARLVTATDGAEVAALDVNIMGAGAMALIGSFLTAGLNLASGKVLQVNATQVVGARVVDARCDDTINSGDATTDGVIDALRDAMITHGLIAAA